MNKRNLLVTLLVTALVSAFAAEPPSSSYDRRSPSPTTTPTTPPIRLSGGCRQSSWNPEVYGFYGAKAAVAAKIAKIPETTPFSDRRVFVQITKDGKKISVKLFERAEDGNATTVTTWQTADRHIACMIDDKVTENKGSQCAGALVKKELTRLLEKPTGSESLSSLASPEAAFTDSVNGTTAEYIETIIILLC